MTASDPDIPPELRGIAEMLERERPALDGLELDRIKQRSMARASRTTAPKGNFMRSRLAIVTTVSLGLLMSGSGAALGISSLTATDNASIAQYGRPTLPKVVDQEVLGDMDDAGGSADTRGGGNVEARPGPDGDVVPGTQRTRQVGTNVTAKLPFTGYASIPILLIGLALLSTGLVLRRSTRTSRDSG